VRKLNLGGEQETGEATRKNVYFLSITSIYFLLPSKQLGEGPLLAKDLPLENNRQWPGITFINFF
jgi:hypothetical protein